MSKRVKNEKQKSISCHACNDFSVKSKKKISDLETNG